MIFLFFLAVIPIERLDVDILDLQDESNPDTHFSGIQQIETNKNFILIRAVSLPYILVFDKQGKWVKNIGEKGEGPKHIASYAEAMGVNEQLLWVLDAKGRMHGYDIASGQHFSSFKHPVRFFARTTSSHCFAVGKQSLVIPCDLRENALAINYDFSGQVIRKVGTPLSKDKEDLMENLGFNETYWSFHKNKWYMAFKFHPTIIVYDNDFNEINRFDFMSPEIDQGIDRILNDKTKHSRGFPMTLFSDLKVTDKMISLMCEGGLLAISRDGKVYQRYIFGGSPEQEKRHEGPFANYLHAPDGKRLIVTHPSIRWYDLAIVKEGD